MLEAAALMSALLDQPPRAVNVLPSAVVGDLDVQPQILPAPVRGQDRQAGLLGQGQAEPVAQRDAGALGLFVQKSRQRRAVLVDGYDLAAGALCGVDGLQRGHA
jgi:hypothetical protein